MTDQALTQEQDEFEKAFAEAGAASKATEPPQPKPQADPPADPPAETHEDKPAAEANPGETPAVDPLEELRKQLAEVQHRERSSANRVSHFMRESSQLAQRVKSLQAENEQLKAATKAPAAKVEAGDDDLKDVLAGAPDLQAAVERRIQKAVASVTTQLEAANKRLAEVGEVAERAVRHVEPLASREERRQAEEVFAALDRGFEGWREEVKSEGFHSWLQAQPRAIQHLYERGSSVQDASTVLTLYHASKGAPRSAQPEPNAGKGATDDTNKQRLREAAGIAPRAVQRAPTKKDDFEGSFAEFAAQMRKR